MKRLLSRFFSGLRQHFISVGYSGMDDEADIIALMIGSIAFACHIVSILFLVLERDTINQYTKIGYVVIWIISGVFNYLYVTKSNEYKRARLLRYTLKDRIYCITYVSVSIFIFLVIAYTLRKV